MRKMKDKYLLENSSLFLGYSVSSDGVETSGKTHDPANRQALAVAQNLDAKITTLLRECAS